MNLSLITVCQILVTMVCVIIFQVDLIAFASLDLKVGGEFSGVFWIEVIHSCLLDRKKEPKKQKQSKSEPKTKLMHSGFFYAG